MDTQLIGAFALMFLALLGVTFDMTIPAWLPVVSSAVTGSIQSLFARARKGYIKGFKAMFSAFTGGLSGGFIMGYGAGVIMGLEGSIAIILPVYIFSLMGARLALFIATEASVEGVGNGIIGMFNRKGD